MRHRTYKKCMKISLENLEKLAMFAKVKCRVLLSDMKLYSSLSCHPMNEKSHLAQQFDNALARINNFGNYKIQFSIALFDDACLFYKQKLKNVVWFKIWNKSSEINDAA